MNNISFVIPAYNCGNTIEESVDSIFNDNFTDGDEVIIVNDGSSDNTSLVIDKIVKKYALNIIFVNNEINRGCPASRNIGIAKARNDLIFNLDSDNILDSGSIVKLKDALLSQSADVAAFKEYWYFKKSIYKITHKWICLDGVFSLADLFSGFFNPASGGNFLYKKDFYKKINGYWEYGKGLHEAWGFTLKLLVNDAKFIVVQNTHYFHRYSHESLFVRENKKKDEGIIITNKFIEPALVLLSDESLEYVKSNQNWFNYLTERPLILKNKIIGKNGKMVYCSIVKQLIYKLKSLIK